MKTNLIQGAAQILKQGGLVAIPTETVYGLAANALDERAVAKIFEAKGRPSFDPLIIHLADRQNMERYCQAIPAGFDQLYEKFSPGPITYILPKTNLIPDLVTAGHPTVALRFPSHPLGQALLQSLDFPLAAPSANQFGKVSPTQASHVAEQLGDRVDLILDGGPCSVGIESTIIDLSQASPRILRLGGLAAEDIEEALGHRISINATSSSNPKAPGMLSAHYSPGIKLLHGSLESNLKLINPQRTGIIAFCQKVAGIPEQNQRVLAPNCDLKAAAANLFSALRSFKADEIDVILADKFPDEGLGRAINDRLRRASVS